MAELVVVGIETAYDAHRILADMNRMDARRSAEPGAEDEVAGLLITHPSMPSTLGESVTFANPTGSPSPNLMQKMTFKKDGKEFAKTPLEPAQLTQTGPNTFLVGNAFDPETFPAGHYTLELQVRDMNAADDSPLRKQGWVLTSEFDVVSCAPPRGGMRISAR